MDFNVDDNPNTGLSHERAETVPRPDKLVGCFDAISRSIVTTVIAGDERVHDHLFGMLLDHDPFGISKMIDGKANFPSVVGCLVAASALVKETPACICSSYIGEPGNDRDPSCDACAFLEHEPNPLSPELTIIKCSEFMRDRFFWEVLQIMLKPYRGLYQNIKEHNIAVAKASRDDDGNGK